MFKEFKAFIAKGNVIDLAVAVNDVIRSRLTDRRRFDIADA